MFATRLYAWLLKAYPAGFRQDYEALMIQLFRDRLREARQGGFSVLLLFWLHTLADLLTNAFEEHMIRFSQRPAGYAMQALGVAAAAATWPLLLWTHVFCMMIVADPAAGAATGTIQGHLVHWLGRPPGLLLLPVILLGYSSLIMARSAMSGRGGRWMAWRFALVNLIATPVMIGVILAAHRAVSILFPPVLALPGSALRQYSLAAYALLALVYGLLIAGLLHIQRLVANPVRRRAFIPKA